MRNGFIKTGILAVFLLLSFTACNKATFDAFFANLESEVPLEKVSYKVAKPQKDTVFVWFAPYKIFKNTTQFEADSIRHEEKFNWEGLGDFLWTKYQEKKRKKGKQEDNRQGLIMKDLFLSVFDKLNSDVSSLQYIDKFRNQFQNETEEHPLFTPCAFIELASVEWSKLNKKEQVGTVLIRVHIGQSNYQDTFEDSPTQASALASFDLVQSVYLALQGHSGAKFTPLNRVRSNVANEYTNLIVEQIEFECRYTDSSVAEIVTDTIEPDLHVSKA